MDNKAFGPKDRPVTPAPSKNRMPSKEEIEARVERRREIMEASLTVPIDTPDEMSLLALKERFSNAGLENCVDAINLILEHTHKEMGT